MKRGFSFFFLHTPRGEEEEEEEDEELKEGERGAEGLLYYSNP